MCRTVLSIFIVTLSLSVAGCTGGGSSYRAEGNLKANIAVTVARQILADPDQKIVVYANDFSKDKDILIFKCPCYLAETNGAYIHSEVSGDLFQLKLLYGAPYLITVRYLNEQKNPQ